MVKKSKIIFYFILDIIFIAALVWLDQWTKGMAELKLKGQPPVALIRDVLVLQYLYPPNTGAAWGIFKGHMTLFLIVGTLFLIAMVALLLLLPPTKKYRILRFFLCLISAGAAGNMIDRAVRHYVIDFIYAIFIDFPIFNVADMYVTIGAFALVVLLLFVYKEDDLNLKKAWHPKVQSYLRPVEKKDKADG
ncbi:MAG: signal peptidase II [Lachnospiraceae bacterium]|nr:signal peptidase II [Lachnospiraceae bacterium]